MSTREIVLEPTGRQRDALLRAAHAKHEADERCRGKAAEYEAAMAAHVVAADRLADVLVSLTGEEPQGLNIDMQRGVIYREVEEGA